MIGMMVAVLLIGQSTAGSLDAMIALDVSSLSSLSDAGQVITLVKQPNPSSSSSASVLPNPPNKPTITILQDELRYIPSNKLHQKDYFSGSFFLSTKTFLKQLKPRQFTKLESPTLELLARTPSQKSKMVMDWTELNVEHFSHWWKTMFRLLMLLLQEEEEQQIIVIHQWMERIVEIFRQYIQVKAPQQLHRNLEYYWQQQQQQQANDGEIKLYPMQQTIGVIAFQPYRLLLPNNDTGITLQQQELEQALTIHSLAATMASMVATGMGRILVVGYQTPWSEATCVQQAFRLINDAFQGTVLLDRDDGGEERMQQDNKPTTTTTTTSLGYVAIQDETWVRNFRRKKLFNLQMGVVKGLQMAFKGYVRQNLTRQQEWLGVMPFNDNNHESTNKPSWQHVYLTEPDLLLQTKPHVLPLLVQGMQQHDFHYFPHRLQPLPHQADFANLAASVNDSYLYSQLLSNKGTFGNITALDDDHACCDFLALEYPGRAKEFGWRQHQVPCGDWWWTCGFVHNRGKVPKDSMEHNHNATTTNGNHLRLARYQMMRLARGSGVVFGSTEQGRQCIPQRGPCDIAG